MDVVQKKQQPSINPIYYLKYVKIQNELRLDAEFVV